MRRSTIATCKREIVRRERASGQRNVALRRELNDRILSGGGVEAFFKRLFGGPRGGKKVTNGWLYTKTHEWVEPPDKEVKITDETEEVRCGITDYAQHEMGDILHVELPKVGALVTAGDSFAQVESDKATVDIHAPLSGKVAAINERLADNPALLNTDPYGKGWICKLETSFLDIAVAVKAGGLLGAGPYATHINA